MTPKSGGAAPRARRPSRVTVADFALAFFAGALAFALSGPPAHAMGVFAGDSDAKPLEATIPDPMPKVPAPGDALEFYVSPTTTNRFAIDPASLAVEGERVVRFLLVITSSSGVRNVSYEAFRCDRAEHRLLAIARSDGGWSRLDRTRWEPLNRDDTVNRHHPELFAKLCDGGLVAAQTRERLIARIRATPRIMP